MATSGGLLDFVKKAQRNTQESILKLIARQKKCGKGKSSIFNSRSIRKSPLSECSRVTDEDYGIPYREKLAAENKVIVENKYKSRLGDGEFKQLFTDARNDEQKRVIYGRLHDQLKGSSRGERNAIKLNDDLKTYKKYNCSQFSQEKINIYRKTNKFNHSCRTITKSIEESRANLKAWEEDIKMYSNKRKRYKRCLQTVLSEKTKNEKVEDNYINR